MRRNGCIALHYCVHFLQIFSFVTRGIEREGIRARSNSSQAQPDREDVGIELRADLPTLSYESLVSLEGMGAYHYTDMKSLPRGARKSLRILGQILFAGSLEEKEVLCSRFIYYFIDL